jgi:hypothetical protein
MLLRPGFTVNLLDPGVTRDSVSICSGSRLMADTSHAPNCVVAAGDWRDLTDVEADVILGADLRPLSTTVSLLDLGPQLLQDGHDTLLPLLAGGSDTAQPVYVEALRTFQSQVSQALQDRYGIVPETTGAADLVVHRPDQPSTAFNPGIGAFMGLHIDSHQQLPFGDRAGAMTLCAMNVGFADRYLNFVNLPVRDLIEVLADRGVDPPVSAGDVKNAFFAEFPAYPVLRLTIRPGEAYLCNTQNTIHDGATNRTGSPDISFLTLHRMTNLVPHHSTAAAR